MQNVVESRKYHQHDARSRARYETRPPGPVPIAAGPERLDSVEQKVTAIEQRDRKQVEETDRDRKHRQQDGSARTNPRSRDLAGYLGDADRATELVGRFAADHDAGDEAERAFDHEPCLLHAELERSQGIDPLSAACASTGDAEHARSDARCRIILELRESAAWPL